MDQLDQKQLEQLKQQQAQKEQMEEIKKSILTQILTPEAKQRLANIKLVKPEKAELIEVQLCQWAKQGKITNQLSEDELIKLLEAAEGQKKQETKVTFQRRKLSSDDDDDI
ncbi:unnamed protein product [Paramecium primaurelia]|uniref:Programmed cell death protein 5 n=2 Tax=Paramecium TaxID=5884 RepID=A0A8S1UIB2_9CILI|nr:unnamed protein product [Paramecium primaurelia]CAD8162406.1 unnamed protein product [Paramecium pentaurelia]